MPTLKYTTHRASSDLTVEEYFWERVDKNGPVPEQRPDLGPCWLWTGNISPKGYGRLYFKDVRKQAHVYSHELHHKPLGKDLKEEQRDHLCRVRRCVNPNHLEVVTRRENILRGEAPPAQNARRNTCVKGHLIEGLRKNGGRYCLVCNNERANASYHKKEHGESPTAMNASKTHCIRGHLLTGVVKSRPGHRYCVTCNREQTTARNARLREEKHK